MVKDVKPMMAGWMAVEKNSDGDLQVVAGASSREELTELLKSKNGNYTYGRIASEQNDEGKWPGIIIEENESLEDIAEELIAKIDKDGEEYDERRKRVKKEMKKLNSKYKKLSEKKLYKLLVKNFKRCVCRGCGGKCDEIETFVHALIHSMPQLKESCDDLIAKAVREQKGEAGVAIGIASGASMLPTVEPGDMVIQIISPSIMFNEGDIVLAYHQGKQTMHRVLKEKGDSVYLHGDNNGNNIEKINRDAVIAKVADIVKKDDKRYDVLRGAYEMWKGEMRAVYDCYRE